MDSYLDKIMATKADAVAAAECKVSLSQLKSVCLDMPPAKPFAASIMQRNGIIAEFKRQSPSKGLIHGNISPAEVVPHYEAAGVSAVSVLTDEQFFGGSIADVREAASVLTSIPVLRKEFINSAYQVYEARAAGASAILLIAAVLEPAQAADLAGLASELGLEVLMELHTADEMDRIVQGVSVVGINNRDLRTFKVDLQHSMQLATMLPAVLPKISESGIGSIDDMLMLRRGGFNGFLIGENFMKHNNPGAACKIFCNQYSEELKNNKL